MKRMASDKLDRVHSQVREQSGSDVFVDPREFSPLGSAGASEGSPPQAAAAACTDVTYRQDRYPAHETIACS